LLGKNLGKSRFAEYLIKVFTLNTRKENCEEQETIFNRQKSTELAEIQTAETTSLTKHKLKVIISKALNAEKVPRYDLIIGRILKKLCESGIIYLTQLFNVILKTDFFPPQSKVTQ